MSPRKRQAFLCEDPRGVEAERWLGAVVQVDVEELAERQMEKLNGIP